MDGGGISLEETDRRSEFFFFFCYLTDYELSQQNKNTTPVVGEAQMFSTGLLPAPELLNWVKNEIK